MAGYVPLDDKSSQPPLGHALGRAQALSNFEFARSRFVQSMMTGADITRVVDEASKKRDKLHVEIENLRELARQRHRISIEDARAYQEILPHRVTVAGMQAPTAMEKMGASFGSDRAYKRAVKSTKEYVEARDLFVKKRDQLTHVEETLRKTLHAREEAIVRQLEADGGLEKAFQRDPLLHNAYRKLMALEDVLDHAAPDTETP
jgi:hypothetical protein